MKKRKHMSPLEAMLKVQTAPVAKTSAPYRRETDKEKFDRECAEEQQAAIQPLLDEQNRLLRAHRKEWDNITTSFWSKPLKDLLTPLTPNDPLAADEGVDLQPCSQRDGRAERAAFEEFVATHTARSGVTLGVAGEKRLVGYATVQSQRGMDITTQQAWDTMFERLNSQGCFAEGEVGYDPALITVKPAPATQPEESAESFDSVLNRVDTFSRSGRKEIEDAAMRSMGVDCLMMFQAWTASLEQNFGYYPTAAEIKAVTDNLKARDANFMHAKEWDRSRLIAIQQGAFNPQIKYPSEILNERIESSDFTGPSAYAAKRELRTELRKLGQIQH